MSLELELRSYLDGLPAEARARLAEVAARFEAPTKEEVVLVDLMAFTGTVPVQVVAMTESDEVIAGVVLGVWPIEGLVLRPEGWLRLATVAQLTPVEIQSMTDVEEKTATLRGMLARDRSPVAPAAFVAGLAPEERAILRAAAAHFGSPEAFLAWAELQPERYEMVDGVVRKAAGGSLTHARLSRNALTALIPRLRTGPCEAFGADLAVILGPQHVFLPSASVSCEPDAGPGSTQPIVVIEVLSPTTAGYDLDGRVLAYQRLPSLRHLVLIRPDRVGVRHLHRDAEGQEFSSTEVNRADDVLQLTAIGFQISVAELYAQVTLAG